MQAFLKPKVPKQVDKMEEENPQKCSPLVPWVEKYRPNRLADLTSQEQVVRSFEGITQSGNLPHLLLYGPAGTGKTSSVIALAKELFGPHIYKQRILELNASDDRGIGAVRDKVKKFAMAAIMKNVDKKYLCPQYKIIILDEADSMTNDAQSALRRIMEDFSKTTRFILVCNYITKYLLNNDRIIEPLASRCIKFRFRPVPLDLQLAKLQQICHKQSIKISRQVIVSLLSQGDLRKSINSLQSLHNVNTVPQILPMPQCVCQNLFEVLKFSNNLQAAVDTVNEIVSEGWPFDQLLRGMLRQTMNINDNRKVCLIFQAIAKADAGINMNGSEIQIIDAVTSIFYILHSNS